eukprot:COSAG01_NODE_649_length_14487_cov_12.974624_5_plen_79_part_00
MVTWAADRAAPQQQSGVEIVMTIGSNSSQSVGSRAACSIDRRLNSSWLDLSTTADRSRQEQGLMRQERHKHTTRRSLF